MSIFGGKKVEELEDRIEERLNKFEQSISARVVPLNEALKRLESRLVEIQGLLGTLASQPESIRSKLCSLPREGREDLGGA
jgi:chromosome segregation ATPase